MIVTEWRTTFQTSCKIHEQVLTILLQAVLLPIQRNMWLMHDGDPPHFSIRVHNFLNATYYLWWFGCGGSVAKPHRSSVLNRLDFFFWWHMKYLVYKEPAVTAGRIQTTIGVFERLRQSFVCRCQLCNDTRGRHFEQLMWVFHETINLIVQFLV